MASEQNRPRTDRGTEEQKRRNAVPKKPMGIFYKCLLVVIFGLSVTFFATKLMDYNRLRQATDEVQAEIEAHESVVDELQYLLNAPVDDAYIIRIARSKLGLVFPDERVFFHDFDNQR